MLKRMLIALGLQAAPSPYAKYLQAASFFGVTPVALWVAWKNREQIVSTVRRLTAASHAQTQHA